MTLLRASCPGKPAAAAVTFSSAPRQPPAGSLRLPLASQAGILARLGLHLLYFAARLAWGLIRPAVSRAPRHRFPSRRYQHFAASKYCQRLGITARCRGLPSPRTAGPVTIGLRRGLVLVPPRSRKQSRQDDLDAVLAHELAHIARHDFAKNLLYGLSRCPSHGIRCCGVPAHA